MKRMTPIIIFALLTIGLMLPTTAQEEDLNLTITWVTDTELSIWRSETGQISTLVMAAGISRPTLSPTGNQIIYQQNDLNGNNRLWRVDSSGGDPQVIASLENDVILGQLFWVDDTTILVNFYRHDPPLGFLLDETITRIDTTSDELSTLPQGGFMSPNPSRTGMTISQSGRYEEEPGIIWHMDLNANSEPIQLQTFDAPATASHQPFYPQTHWLDDTTFVYALPQPDALYLEGNQPIPLYRVNVDGEVETAGTLETDLFGLPRWSPNNEHILFLQSTTENIPGDTTQVILAGPNGQETVTAFPFGSVLHFDWLDNNHYYFVLQDGNSWLGTTTGEATLWRDESDVFYVNTAGVLVFAILGEPMKVAYQTPDQTEPNIITEVGIVFGIDAIRLENE